MLRVRTGYSFRVAAGSLEDVAGRLKELGCTRAPITDTASTFGYYRWSKLCEKMGMEPVFGVELAVSNNPSAAKMPPHDMWTFFAKGSIKPINDLVYTATKQFRYQPMLLREQALAMEGVNIITGHRCLVDWEKPQPSNLLVSLAPSTPRHIIRKARELGWQFAATSDNNYPRETDSGFYEVLTGRTLELHPQHILSSGEWREACSTIGATDDELDRALVNAAFILNDGTAKLQRSRLPTPEKPRTLREMCIEGAKDFGCDLTDPVYEARLERELALIEKKGYDDYFYIVADICSYARSQLLVGPGRGSSGGSLVCYLLGITTVDPIPHGLIFERFIDINRDDMPDIDIDFADKDRQLVFDYIDKTYGKERVARLGTVAMYHPRSALNDISAALKLPRWKCDAVAESMIDRSSGDSRALQTLEDTLRTMPAGKKLIEDHPEALIVTKFEGHPKHYSQHAAGVVISDEAISEFVAIDARTGASMCDKKDAEGLNLLKIDALGLVQLSVFQDCLRAIGKPLDFLETLPLDDALAFEVLNQQKWSGIFQWNGQALQSITKQITVTSFDDIASVTALARPGPLASGGAHEWVRRHTGQVPVTYPHAIFEPYLSDTLGCVLYQEQVMEIGRNIGDLGWEEVTALRKAMSKSLGKEYFDQFGDPWKKGAIAKGVDPVAANKIWDDLCAYGAWSFNKSHSVAYGLISYWCCWLKAHHPLQFAAATLTHESDPDKQIKMLREMVKEGYTYVPFSTEHSTLDWVGVGTSNSRQLVGPITNVKGVGPKRAKGFVSYRDQTGTIRASESDRKAYEQVKKILETGTTSVDSLFPIKDAFARELPNPAERNIHTPPTDIIDILPDTNDREYLVFCVISKINPRDENEVVIVARRGYEVKDGKETSLNLQLEDDTDTIFGKINRYDYERLGQEIVNRGKPGKHLYAMKGRVGGGMSFRMLQIKQVRYIGPLEPSKDVKEEAEVEKEEAELGGLSKGVDQN